MESTLRTFTKKAKGLYDTDYWSRLKIMKLNSLQRRVDKYRIIYSWKSINGCTPLLGMKWNEISTGRNGRVLRIPKVEGISESLKNLRRNSIQHYGVKLLNILPKEIRNFIREPDAFKSLLDSFLCKIPDQPEKESMKADVLDYNSSSSNSVYDWCNRRNFEWKPNIELLKEGEGYMCKATYNQSMGRLSQTYSMCA